MVRKKSYKVRNASGDVNGVGGKPEPVSVDQPDFVKNGDPEEPVENGKAEEHVENGVSEEPVQNGHSTANGVEDSGISSAENIDRQSSPESDKEPDVMPVSTKEIKQEAIEAVEIVEPHVNGAADIPDLAEKMMNSIQSEAIESVEVVHKVESAEFRRQSQIEEPSTDSILESAPNNIENPSEKVKEIEQDVTETAENLTEKSDNLKEEATDLKEEVTDLTDEIPESQPQVPTEAPPEIPNDSTAAEVQSVVAAAPAGDVTEGLTTDQVAVTLEERAGDGQTAVQEVAEAKTRTAPSDSIVIVEEVPDHNTSAAPTLFDVPAPSDKIWTTSATGATMLRMSEEGPSADPPTTIMTCFRNTAANHGPSDALGWKAPGSTEWTRWTWAEYLQDVEVAARGFMSLGLDPAHAVGILGFNSPHWFISNFAAIFAGGMSTGIYATNTADACRHVLSDSRAQICVVENDKQLAKILEVWDQLPQLKAVVQYIGEPEPQHENVYSWDQLLKLGREQPEEVLTKRQRNVAPNHCSTLIYTSGTTGAPKGVMLSHDNLIWTAKFAWNAAVQTTAANSPIGKPVTQGDVIGVSYLPLSHVAGQIFDMYIPIIASATMYFCGADALKGSLVNTLKEVRPTIFLGVPRVYEKIQEAMIEQGSKLGTLKKKISLWAKNVGRRAADSGSHSGLSWTVANKLVFQKARQALGLDRTAICFCGAAPMAPATLQYFLSLNIPVMDAYGMSETTGPAAVNSPASHRFGSSGPGIGDTYFKIDKPDEKGEGEVCMRGRHIFMGYLNNEEKTAECLDDEGWIHSGDIGKVDKDGFLYITGRIKEILVTAGGENVAPIPIEEKVKEQLSCISQCMMVGDKRKFLALLITFKVKQDPDTQEPTTELDEASVRWCQSVGSQATQLDDILENKDTAVLAAIQKGIDTVNSAASSNAQRIQKWTILPSDFSMGGGELGPTLKVKRFAILKKYEDTVEGFYAE